MSARAFIMDLHREHLEEIAILYDLRLDWLCDWESTPDDVAELEARIEAHLDALAIGGERALHTAMAMMSKDDPWGLYGLVALACREGRSAGVHVALLELDGLSNDEGTDPHTAAGLRQAVADALVHHLPDDRAGLVLGALREASPHVLPVLATCIGARCWVQAVDELQDAAARPCADPAAVLRALSQLPGAGAEPLLAAVGSNDPLVAQTAAIGALRRGEASVLDILTRRPRAPWAALPVAMSAGPSAFSWLVDAAYEESPAEALLALGIFGDPAALDVLLGYLDFEEHATAAAIGLYLLTGALLDASVLDGLAANDLPEPAPAEPPWASIQRSGISTDPMEWTAWVAERRHCFVPGKRHRLGALATPHTELALISARVPLWLRRLLADEFAIRYGVVWAFEPDLLVAQQRELMGPVRARLDDPRLRFVEGSWYFQGSLAR